METNLAEGQDRASRGPSDAGAGLRVPAARRRAEPIPPEDDDCGDRNASAPAPEPPPAMLPWQRWDRFHWSAALVDAYFGLHSAVSAPVRVLDISRARIAAIARAEPGDADSVVQRIFTLVTNSAGGDSPWKKAGEVPPWQSLFYLVAGCMAMGDASEDEDSSLELLQQHLGSRALSKLERLPGLWTRLQRWLDASPDVYRPLVIPSPGGWTRIGETFRLTFPPRPDAAVLTELLEQAGGAGERPPLSRVVGVLRSPANRRRFSRRFRAELDDFLGLVGQGKSLQELYAHPLWTAVISAAGRDSTVDVEGGAEVWGLVAYDNGYDLDLIVVCSDGAAEDVEALPEAIDTWTHEVVDGWPRLVADQHGRALGALKRAVAEGLIPLIDRGRGFLEVAQASEVDAVEVAVVRSGIVTDFIALFGGTTRVLGSAEGGWAVVRGCALRLVEDDRLIGTALEGCHVLHASPTPVAMIVKGGVRIGDAWLAKNCLLPRVEVAGASAVSAMTPSGRIPLLQGDAGWSFPDGCASELEGEVVLRAAHPLGAPMRRARFVKAPALEQLREPRDGTAWLVEDVFGSVPLDVRASEASRVAEIPVLEVDRITWLGRDVGSFTSSRDGATWALTRFGATKAARLLCPNALVPTRRSASAHGRRRWRLALRDVERCATARDVAAKARAAYSNRHDALPVVEMPPPPDVVDAAAPPPPRPEVDDVIEVLCAMGEARTGVTFEDWTALCRQRLPVDSTLEAHVHRAWIECGGLEELHRRRGYGTVVLPVCPHLIRFDTPTWAAATLRGLVLPSTRERLCAEADRLGVFHAEIRNFSPLVPPTISFRSADATALDALATALGLPMRALERLPAPHNQAREPDSPPPSGYELGYPTRSTIDLADVRVDRWFRSRCPQYWTVTSGAVTVWSHTYAGAERLAAVLSDQPLVEAQPDGQLVRVHAYLPLPIARWVNAIAPVLSGPDGETYRYQTPSVGIASTVAAAVTAAYAEVSRGGAR